MEAEPATQAEASSSPSAMFLAGVKAELPILVGVLPFGLIYGVVAIGAGIPPLAAQAMSAVLFAGSAQFLTAQLYGLGTPAVVIILAAAVINLRHLLYSASISAYTQRLNRVWKWLLAYLLTDEAYAVTILYYQRTPASGRDQRHWFFLGAGMALWSAWQASTAVGLFLGEQVPPSWSLDFTLALTFIALMTPHLKDLPSLATALASGALAVIAFALPFKLGLLFASLTGIALGVWLEMRTWKSGS